MSLSNELAVKLESQQIPSSWPKWATYWTLTAHEARFWGWKPFVFNDSVWSLPLCPNAEDTMFRYYTAIPLKQCILIERRLYDISRNGI